MNIKEVEKGVGQGRVEWLQRARQVKRDDQLGVLNLMHGKIGLFSACQKETI